MIYSTVNHQKLPFSDPTHPPLWWRNTWMVPMPSIFWNFWLAEKKERKKTHFWFWLRVNSCMANGTKLPFQVQPARSPLILTSTKTSDSAYFCRGKKMEENCSLRLQPFTFSHEIIQSSFIHQNNGHHFQATTTMIELLLFHFYPFLMISNFEFRPALS